MEWVGFGVGKRVFPCRLEQQLGFSGFVLNISTVKVALTIQRRRFIGIDIYNLFF